MGEKDICTAVNKGSQPMTNTLISEQRRRSTTTSFVFRVPSNIFAPIFGGAWGHLGPAHKHMLQIRTVLMTAIQNASKESK